MWSQVWQDALARKAVSPYLVHNLETGHVEQLAFCPYEDVLACGAAGLFQLPNLSD